MTIDIEPHEIKIADKVEQISMEYIGVKEMYYFKRNDGEESVKWCADKLSEFRPRELVSEFIEMDTLKYQNIYLHSIECWEKRIHPFSICTVEYHEWSEKWASPLEKDLTSLYNRQTLHHIKNSKQKILNPWRFIKIIIEHPKYPTGSEWILRHSWGDVDGVIETHDNEKKVIFKVTGTTDTIVLYTINYYGNPNPNKIYECSFDEFDNDLKLKKKNIWL